MCITERDTPATMANESAKFMKNAYIGWTNTHGMYYPHDFDPNKLVAEKKYKGEKSKSKLGVKAPRLMNIRMMMPFSMICGTCGNFTYVATKFNSRVEKIQNESYFGCAVYRFYGSCQHCLGAFTFKTDPATADYVMETGGSRSYECWKDADGAIDEVAKTKEEEAAHDSMKALEQASEAAAAEMQINDALDGVRQINNRNKNPYETITQALEFFYKKNEGSEELIDIDNSNTKDFEDELEAYRAEQTKRKRKEMDDEIVDHDVFGKSSSSFSSCSPGLDGSSIPTKKARIKEEVLVSATKMAPPSSIIVKKKTLPATVKVKTKIEETGGKKELTAVKEEVTEPIPTAAAFGFGAYDSDSSE